MEVTTCTKADTSLLIFFCSDKKKKNKTINNIYFTLIYIYKFLKYTNYRIIT